MCDVRFIVSPFLISGTTITLLFVSRLRILISLYWHTNLPLLLMLLNTKIYHFIYFVGWSLHLSYPHVVIFFVFWVLWQYGTSAKATRDIKNLWKSIWKLWGKKWKPHSQSKTSCAGEHMIRWILSVGCFLWAVNSCLERSSFYLSQCLKYDLTQISLIILHYQYEGLTSGPS